MNMRIVERVITVGQNIIRSLGQPLTLNPRFVMVSYLTHGDAVEGALGRELDAGWGDCKDSGRLTLSP